jgi:hypothetical protein
VSIRKSEHADVVTIFSQSPLDALSVTLFGGSFVRRILSLAGRGSFTRDLESIPRNLQTIFKLGKWV